MEKFSILDELSLEIQKKFNHLKWISWEVVLWGVLGGYQGIILSFTISLTMSRAKDSFI